MTQRKLSARSRINTAFITLACAILPALAGIGSSAEISQQGFPDPPNDLTRVYYLTTEHALLPLPFEPGIAPLNVFVPAKKDQVVQLHVKGPAARTVLTDRRPAFYVFVADRMDPPPHQLVRLAPSKFERQLSISVIRGRKGYAPFGKDNVVLERRLLARLRVAAGPNRVLFVNYMEVRPRTSLDPGEYAIIGDSLADLATFQIK